MSPVRRYLIYHLIIFVSRSRKNDYLHGFVFFDWLRCVVGCNQSYTQQLHTVCGGEFGRSACQNATDAFESMDMQHSCGIGCRHELYEVSIENSWLVALITRSMNHAGSMNLVCPQLHVKETFVENMKIFSFICILLLHGGSWKIC